MNAKEYHIAPRLTDEEVNKLKGALLGEQDYNVLFTEDADVYCSETGKCIAKFRKKVIPSNIAKDAYESLKSVSILSSNRGASAGLKDNGKSTAYKVKKDGTLSNTNHAGMVNSGIIGFFDRNARFP